MVRKHQTTIASSCSFMGIGVHNGKISEIRLSSASAGTGVLFRVHGVEFKIGSIIPEDALHATVLRKNGASLSTVEHLLAALRWCNVDNVEIELVGEEIPILDGSALPLVHTLLQVGTRCLDEPRLYLRPLSKITMIDDKEERLIECIPHDDEDNREFLIDFHSSFDHTLIGSSRIVQHLTSDYFIREIAPARTFGFLHQISFLRAHDLARGSALGNTVVFTDCDALGELRFDDEPARHKLLDFLGDLALLGHAFAGKIRASRTGHHFNRLLIEHYVKHPHAWKLFMSVFICLSIL